MASPLIRRYGPAAAALLVGLGMIAGGVTLWVFAFKKDADGTSRMSRGSGTAPLFFVPAFVLTAMGALVAVGGPWFLLRHRRTA